MPSGKVLLTLCLAAALVGVTTAAAIGSAHTRDAGPSTASATESAEAPGNATLVVVVDATGGDASFPFRTTGGEGLPSEFTLATADGAARITFGGLRAGHNYTLEQTVPTGWALTRAACDAGTPDNLTLRDNETTTCTFEDTRLATLHVRVLAAGGDASFPFRATGGHGLPAAFNVTTANGTGTAAFTVASNVTYNLTQDVPTGWNLTSAGCTWGMPGNLTLAPGETATCTFDLARLNTLVVRVHALGGDGTFPFTTSGAGGLPATFDATTVQGAATLVFADLATDRAYALHEVVPSGWKLSHAACSQGTPQNVTLAKGDTATCTFNHTRLGALSVNVLARGGDATFTLTTNGASGLPAAFTVATAGGAGSATFTGLDPDLAHVLALAAPSGWRLAAGACTLGTPASFTVAPGGATTCTFELTRLAEVRGLVWHDLDADAHPDADEAGLAGWVVHLDADGDGAQDAGEPLGVTNATGHYVLAGVAPGSYVLRQATPAGWRLTAPAGATYALTLAEGALVPGLHFGAALLAPPAPAPTPGTERDPETGARGPGFWKNWDAHGKHDEAQLDAWLRAISNASAWLMPANVTPSAEGMSDLLAGATGQCSKTYGHHECARRKFEARYLVLRLNVESGRLAWNATAPLPEGAATYLGLPATATVRQVVDAIEAKAATQPTREQYDLLRHAASTGGE